LNIILFINLLCTGIVFSSSVILFFFGSKIISTRFHSLHWFFLFIYLLTLNIREAGVCENFLLHYPHLFIPAFYGLFIFVSIKDKFNFLYLLIFIIPFVSIFFEGAKLFAIIYHLIFWSILIIFTVIVKKYSKNYNKGQKKSFIYFNILSVVLIFIAVFPFIIINLLLIISSKDYSAVTVIESMLPPCLAFVSLLILIFSYKGSFIIFDHEYYANIDFLKKSNVTEKKTIIEKISAGLIHELKNPLTAIQSLNQQLLVNYKNIKRDKIKEYLEIISKEVIRTKELSETYLKTFKKDNNDNKRLINIYETIKGVYDLIKFDIEKRGINFFIDDSLLNKDVIFDNNRLRQVFLNLIYNSIESDSQNIILYLIDEKETYEVYIKDDGVGISKEIEKKIFTPFFSTKMDGTGMGLVICREILHENFGNLKLITSKKGETTFNISLKKQEG